MKAHFGSRIQIQTTKMFLMMAWSQKATVNLVRMTVWLLHRVFHQGNTDEPLAEGGHDRDGDDNWENDSTQGKRSLGRSPSKAALEAARKKARGNYRCSKCGQPKKGHVCPYQPRYKRRDAEQGEGGGKHCDSFTSRAADHFIFSCVGKRGCRSTSRNGP